MGEVGGQCKGRKEVVVVVAVRRSKGRDGGGGVYRGVEGRRKVVVW